MKAETANEIIEQDGLLVIYMAEHQTGKGLRKLKDDITYHASSDIDGLDILVDLSAVKTSEEGANSVARTFFKNLPFRNMAVFGGSKAVNVGIRLILNLFISPGVGEVKLFKNETQARAWLESVR